MLKISIPGGVVKDAAGAGFFGVLPASRRYISPKPAPCRKRRPMYRFLLVIQPALRNLPEV